jgi:hypothetical protein
MAPRHTPEDAPALKMPLGRAQTELTRLMHEGEVLDSRLCGATRSTWQALLPEIQT